MCDKIRCDWVDGNEIYIKYHDFEWGRPVYDDDRLFEFLLLESMQAGLSWITILKKRENFRAAFDGFDPKKIIHYDNSKIDSLMENAGIIRYRLKILAAINNAKRFLEIVEEYQSFSKFIWRYVEGKPIINEWETLTDIPATTPLSDKISKDLKRLGFKFVGSTTIYAFIQAIGMVNDHQVNCFVRKEIIKTL